MSFFYFKFYIVFFYFRIAVLMYVTSALRLNFFYSNYQRLFSAFQKNMCVCVCVCIYNTHTQIPRVLSIETFIFYCKHMSCKYVYIKGIALYIWFINNILKFLCSLQCHSFLIYVTEGRFYDWQIFFFFFCICCPDSERKVNIICVRHLVSLYLHCDLA